MAITRMKECFVLSRKKLQGMTERNHQGFWERPDLSDQQEMTSWLGRQARESPKTG